MKHTRFLFICLMFIIGPSALTADEITLEDRSVVKGKITSVTKSAVEFTPEGMNSSIEVPRNGVLSIKYDDGHEIKFENGASLPPAAGVPPPAPTMKETVSSGQFSLIREDKTEALLLPFPVRIDLIVKTGWCTAEIFNKKEKLIADGNARIEEYSGDLSFEPVKTDFFVTPCLGFLQRNIEVNDFSFPVEGLNSDSVGFIPGIISDPESGEQLSKESIASLDYSASFQSFYLDAKGGAHLVFGPESFRLILSPFVSVGFLEFRKSAFTFSLAGRKEEYSSGFKFNYLSSCSWGFGCDTGFYIPSIRSGITIGYDRRYISRFEISDGVKFKKIYRDENGLYRTGEETARYSGVDANIIKINVFVFI